jgi:hypothetical protein
MKQQQQTQSRRKSLVEVGEQYLDKNTVILIVNLVILIILVGLLYMVASSAMAANKGYEKDEH